MVKSPTGCLLQNHRWKPLLSVPDKCKNRSLLETRPTQSHSWTGRGDFRPRPALEGPCPAMGLGQPSCRDSPGSSGGGGGCSTSEPHLPTPLVTSHRHGQSPESSVSIAQASINSLLAGTRAPWDLGWLVGSKKSSPKP